MLYRIKIGIVLLLVAGLMFGGGGDDAATDDGHDHVHGDERNDFDDAVRVISVWYLTTLWLLVDRVPLLTLIFCLS